MGRPLLPADFAAPIGYRWPEYVVRRRAVANGLCLELARDLMIIGIALGDEGHDRHRVIPVDGEAADAGIADVVVFQELPGLLLHAGGDIEEEVLTPVGVSASAVSDPARRCGTASAPTVISISPISRTRPVPSTITISGNAHLSYP